MQLSLDANEAYNSQQMKRRYIFPLIRKDGGIPANYRKRVVKFDPIVSVRAFDDDTTSSDTEDDDSCSDSDISNFNPQELRVHVAQTKETCPNQNFRTTALLELLSVFKTHTQSIPHLVQNIDISRFSSPALRITRDDHVLLGNGPECQWVMEMNIRGVLIVESNELFLNLYARCIKALLPHVTVVTARNGLDALDIFVSNYAKGERPPFDLVLANHRLMPRKSEMNVGACTDEKKVDPTLPPDCDKHMNGSDVLSAIQRMDIDDKLRPLLIGSSLNLKQDSRHIVRAGADFLWGVPPPSINEALRNEILMTLLDKRTDGQSGIIIL